MSQRMYKKLNAQKEAQNQQNLNDDYEIIDEPQQKKKSVFDILQDSSENDEQELEQDIIKEKEEIIDEKIPKQKKKKNKKPKKKEEKNDNIEDDIQDLQQAIQDELKIQNEDIKHCLKIKLNLLNYNKGQIQLF